MSITPVGRPKKPQSLKDIPEGMSLADWMKLQEKIKIDLVIARLDGITYERELQFSDGKI